MAILAVVLCSSLLGWGGGSLAEAAGANEAAPSRATILEVQKLFHELGYPLGDETPGNLGQPTKGALRYFQLKYGLPVTGYPNASTIAAMRAVLASLPVVPTAKQGSPHDIVERALGDHAPIFPIAAALAILLAALALTPRLRSAQGSASADVIMVEPEES